MYESNKWEIILELIVFISHKLVLFIDDYK